VLPSSVKYSKVRWDTHTFLLQQAREVEMSNDAGACHQPWYMTGPMLGRMVGGEW
jgi:hypothetical protein